MADKPIRSSEIIEDGFLDAAIQRSRELLDLNHELEQQFKATLAVSRDFLAVQKIDGSKALEAQAKAAKEAANELASLEKVQQENIKLQQLQEKLEQERIKTARARSAQEQQYNKEIEAQTKATEKANKEQEKANSAYSQASKRLSELKKQLKDLAIEGKKNTDEYRNLSAQFRNLDHEVRQADEAVGDFQRNVGNYEGGIIESFSGIGQAIIGAFSVDALLSFGQKILETRAEFQKYEAVLKNTLGSQEAAGLALQRIQTIAAKTPFSVSQLTESYVKLVNQGIKPTNKELISLGDLASSQGKEFDQLTEAIIDAQTGEFERLKEFGVKAKKEGDNVTFTFKGIQTTVKNTSAEITKYITSLGELEGVTGGMAAISETLGGQISNLGDGFDTLFNNLGRSSQGVFSVVLKQFGDLLNYSNELNSRFNTINETLDRAGKKTSLFDQLFEANRVFDGLQGGIDSILNGTESVLGAQATLSKRSIQLKEVQKNLNDQFRAGSISLEQYEKGSALVSAAVGILGAQFKELAPKREDDVRATKEQIKAAEELAKANKALNDQLIKLRIDNTELDKRREEDNAKNEARLAKEKLKESKGNADTKRAIEINIQEKLRQDLVKIRDKYDEQARKKQEEERKAAHDKELKDEQEFQAKLALVETQGNPAAQRIEKELADRKAKREANRKEALQQSQAIIDITAKEVSEQSRIRQEGLDKEISDKEESIDIQRRLAEQGKANTLAFEEEQKRRLELAREQEKEKEVKRQKVLAFFKAFASFLEAGDQTAVALTKAAASIAIADGVAAAFFTGTEKVEDDLKGFKKHNGRDGYHIAVDGSERILTGEQNKMVGDLSNEELAKIGYDYRHGILAGAEYNIMPPKNFADILNDNALLQTMASVAGKIDELKEEIRNKPVTQFEFDKYGDFIKSTIEGGFTKRTKFKQPKPRI